MNINFTLAAKRLLTFVTALMATTVVFASTKIGDLYYNLNDSDKTATVTYLNSSSENQQYVSGALNIPSSVDYNGETYQVISVGYRAFNYCSGLTEVTIPESVTSIGGYAFYCCSGLTSVNIPNAVTSIGNFTFYHCSGLTEVIIPESVTSIGTSAFKSCSGLTSVNIPNAVTSIGDDAFCFCSSLSSVTIPESVTSIGAFAFYNCTSLTSVTIPESVTSIDSYTFDGCSGLTSVTIPESVTSIGNYAFDDCSGLTSIYCDVANPADVTLGSNVFSSVPTSSCTLYVPAGSRALYAAASQWSAFANIVEFVPETRVGLTYTYTDDTHIAWKVSGFTADLPADVVIPALHQGLPVVEIGASAFLRRTGLTSVVIPNSVTTIGNSAFSGCTDLTEVNIPNSVTSIGKYAFRNCSNLTSVTIPESVTSIGTSAFEGCSGLTEVNISDISAWCSIQFGDNYSNPLIYAHDLYLNGEIITDLAIPNSVSSIGDFAFYECFGLTSVTIPDSVTKIGEYAFNRCSLTSITIPDSVTSIGEGAFGYCDLTSVTIGNSVTTIGDFAFWQCIYLTSIDIPNSVTSIGSFAFKGCSGLTSVTIPNSVTAIGDSAFEFCKKLTSVTIPNTVTTIGEWAFKDCTGLVSIYCDASNPSNITLGDEVFSGVPTSTCTLYVPKGSRALYAAASQWSAFTNIVEMTPAVESIELSYDSEIMVGASTTIHATVLPTGANNALTWVSSDPSVATVDDNGVVTAVNVGVVTITATATDDSGVSATAFITVTPKPICATPEIDFDADGNLVVTCETEGAQIHTSIVVDDHQELDHLSGHQIPLTGQYLVTSSATADGYTQSEPATAMLVWSPAAQGTTGIDEIRTETERALLIRSAGENIQIVGTETNEDIVLYNLSGMVLYSDKSVENVTTIPISLTHGDNYIITVGSHTFKYKF